MGNRIRRDKLQIVYNILDVCTTETNKTAIVYQVNLNFRNISSYLDLLTKNDLIKKTGPTVYKTTPNGIKLMRNIENVEKMLKL